MREELQKKLFPLKGINKEFVSLVKSRVVLGFIDTSWQCDHFRKSAKRRRKLRYQRIHPEALKLGDKLMFLCQYLL